MERLESHQCTIELGKKLGASLKRGDVLLLEGDLGAGKTTLTQGIAEGLGVTEYVNSPTFVIISEYFSGRIPLYHMDLYRIEEESQLYDLGIEDYFFGNGVCVVEWPAVAEAFLPENVARLTFRKDGDVREIALTISGELDHMREAYNEYFGI
ncbi:MAG: tRNA (adenosine(37)-N6)-threonylcarbamoyltransferase complex ATPase subunit type 1 TsaE [Peptococcaceae bacterium]|nr:tRNA (adenosine(37)-N6)-threonylcarbamoyltransferase complex ATPase subunit type 1 TsaE [Peptococcaceae bacterium]